MKGIKLIDSTFYRIEDDEYSYINNENEISVNLFKNNEEIIFYTLIKIEMQNKRKTCFQ